MQDEIAGAVEAIKAEASDYDGQCSFSNEHEAYNLYYMGIIS
jgi:hypothetical protein